LEQFCRANSSARRCLFEKMPPRRRRLSGRRAGKPGEAGRIPPSRRAPRTRAAFRRSFMQSEARAGREGAGETARPVSSDSSLISRIAAPSPPPSPHARWCIGMAASSSFLASSPMTQNSARSSHFSAHKPRFVALERPSRAFLLLVAVAVPGLPPPGASPAPPEKYSVRGGPGVATGCRRRAGRWRWRIRTGATLPEPSWPAPAGHPRLRLRRKQRMAGKRPPMTLKAPVPHCNFNRTAVQQARQ
jgi:hypothetical protein